MTPIPKQIMKTLSLFFFLIPILMSSCGNSPQGNVVFVDNVLLFDGFDGRKELQRHLDTLVNQQNASVDSFKTRLLQAKGDQKALEGVQSDFDRLQQLLMSKRQELEKKYTDQVWKQLNGYVREFGEKKGYSFILGASGNGSIMYARNSLDVTNAVLEYANKRYQGE